MLEELKPYYQDDYVTLYHANFFEIMSNFADQSFDCIITDPPYSARTHKNAKKNDSSLGYGVKAVEFESFTDVDLQKAFNEFGRLTKAWVVATVDYNHAFYFENNPPNNLTQKRVGVWVKNNPMPQISADRPSQGWEAITYLHRVDKRSEWNAGGSHGNYVSNLATPTGHPTPKPLIMFSSFVERFTKPGDLILDAFAGGGTTLLAARNLGRKAIGIEIDEKYCELIASRLAQQTLFVGEI